MNSDNNDNSDIPKLKRQDAMTVISIPDLEAVMETELEKEIYTLIEGLLRAEQKKKLETGTHETAVDTDMKKRVYEVVEQLLEM